MNFKEFTQKFYQSEIIHNKIVDQLIYFLSTISKDKESLLANGFLEIDFKINDFLYYYDLVINHQKPIEYIVKEIVFLNLKYVIDEGVFIPRNETEFMVDWILESDFINEVNNVLDLCSGSGVIANTICKYKNSLNVYGVDICSKAVEVAKFNAKIYNLKTKFYLRDIFKLKKDFLISFDLIICNPPYIDENYKLPISVKKYEPKKALYAKDFGLQYYKRYIVEIFPLLKNHSKTIFEIGFDQKDKLAEFLVSQKITNFYFLKDLNQNYRILVIDKC